MRIKLTAISMLLTACALLSPGCKDTECEKIAAVTSTCLKRHCAASGASTAQCTCWEYEMVLAGWTAAPCNDGIDNDGDEFPDCEDPDCWASEACNCSDEEDNDGDGLTDCDEDPDCAASIDCCAIREKAPACCFDGLDNDGDGLTDCEADPDCAHGTDCCIDGEDNDEDGLTDCDDPDCQTNPNCCTDAQQGMEACNCDDGVDNDENGMTDCVDEACWALPSCWDPRNRWHSERIPYCVDAVEGMDQACHKDAVDTLMEEFDCEQTALRYGTGLPGKFTVVNNVQSVDLGLDGYVDEASDLETPLIRGSDDSGEDVDLESITFYDDGWFSSNISLGAWKVRIGQGVPTGAVSLYFLSDECLGALDICDTEKPLSWRRGPDGPMFYELQILPVTATVQLGLWELTDVDGDGTDDLKLRTLTLERR